MEKNKKEREQVPFRIPVIICGIFAVITGLSAMLGWVLDIPRLASVGSGLIPMAPSTATLFILLGIIVIFRAHAPTSRNVRASSAIISAFVALATATLFLLSLKKIHPAIEHLYIPISGDVRGAPVGHMSTITALCIVLVSVSLLASLSRFRKRRAWALAFSISCVLSAVCFALLLAYIIGAPIVFFGSFIPPALPTVILLGMLGAATAMLALPSEWMLQTKNIGKQTSSTQWLVLVFVVLSAGIVAAGLLYFRNYEYQYTTQVKNNLSTIVKLKARDISKFRSERLGDATTLYENESFSDLVYRYFQNSGDTESKELLHNWIGRMRESYNYNRIELLDAKGVSRILLSESSTPLSSVNIRSVPEVLKSGRVFFQDIYRNEHDNKVYLAILVPIIDKRHGAGAIGVLVIRIDPHEYLYPMIETWPTASRTAETLLVRREGNEVVFLNELRFRKGTALKLRYSLNNRELPAAKAALGRETVEEGIDYRGARVMAATLAIPDTPWAIVARIDMSEIYTPMKEMAWMVVTLVTLLILGSAAGAGTILQQQNIRIFNEKQESDRAMRESEQQSAAALYTRSLIEASLDALVVIGPDGKITDVNKATEEVTGIARENLIGTDFSEYFTEPEKAGEGYKLVFSQEVVRDYPLTVRHVSGRTTDVLYHASIYRNQAGAVQGVFAAARDITERKRAEEALRHAEEQLRQSQKLESVGLLAGGIAHDFNNMLTPIIGYAELSLRKMRGEDPNYKYMKRILDAGTRARDLTKQLLAFGRKQTLEMSVIKLNSVIMEFDVMLRRLIKESVVIENFLSPELGAVRADATQIQQIIINLAVNANDAMPEGGKLHFETSNVELDANYCAEHPEVLPGQYIMMAVSDTGCGMNAETMRHIFEPFFTTKKTGEGTGLGLATVYGIVKQHGGSISVYSEPDKGTTFKVYLPRVDEVSVMGVCEDVGKVVRGNETVLVVEDDESVRDLAKSIIEEQGYRVLLAGKPGDALIFAQECREQIDLLLTDVVMPNMNGRELYQRISALHPEMKVLYMSGYTHNIIAHHNVLEDGIHFIQKPFTVTSLTEKLREALLK